MRNFFSKSNLLLILASIIWGCAFVAQNVGMNYIGPWTFSTIRFLIAGFSLLAIIPILDKKRTHVIRPKTKEEKMKLLLGSVLCGLALSIGSIVQQIAMLTVPVAKAGFLTTLYVLFVPMITLLFGKKIPLKVWIGIAMALFGLYLLSMAGNLAIGIGEILLILAAFLFAIHIIIIGHFSTRVDPVRLSCGQLLIGGFATVIPMIVIEKPTMGSILAAYIPLLYTGIFSSCVAYTLQIFAQKEANPTIAGMLLSLESVFAALAGYLILHQVLNTRELIGCVVIFIAIVIAQLPDRRDMVNVTKET
ncbi:DMT family transporter [Solobacterium moorei]|uniref:Putative membrane protein n=1 Tax=Solobacterium moorei F0204 TaxID=706433 RepID=E7MPH9_9FIRM|nr:DMT family transporter [Solobacterium moorei]EFW24084.1 putative membrane protein [Solobacterium moorei F0204]